MSRFMKEIGKPNSWVRSAILFIYIFVILIFKNNLVLKYGENRFYVLVVIGGVLLLLIIKAAVTMWSRSTSKE